MATYIPIALRYIRRMPDKRPSQAAIVQWLRASLDAAGMSQAEFARRLSADLGKTITRDIINRILHDKREVSIEEMYASARILKLDPPTPKVAFTVPLVGIVGAGAEVAFYQVTQEPLDYVDAPPDCGANAVAVEVRGNSMYGVANDGWLLFYEDRHDFVSDDMLGQLCVVGLPGEKVVVKEVLRGSRPGVFNLISTNAAPILDTPVEWAAVVTWIKQRKPR